MINNISNIKSLIDGFSNSKIISYGAMETIINMSREELLHTISRRFNGNGVAGMQKRGYSVEKITRVVKNALNINLAAEGKLTVTEGDNRGTEFNVTTLYTLLNSIIGAKEIPTDVLVNAFKIPQEEFMYIFKAFFEGRNIKDIYGLRNSIEDRAHIHAISSINSETIQRIINKEPYKSEYVMFRSYEDYRERFMKRYNVTNDETKEHTK